MTASSENSQTAKTDNLPFLQSSTSNLSENKHHPRRKTPREPYSSVNPSSDFKLGEMVTAFVSHASMRIRNLIIEPSAIDSEIKLVKYARDNERPLLDRGIDCQLRNFGCLGNYCWAHCGSHVDSDDWCFVNKNDTVNAGRKEVATCKSDSDCSPCLPCASKCGMEGQLEIL